MQAHRDYRTLLSWLLLCTLLTSVGCKVSEKDIDTWKGTVKGPGKMVAVMMASKFDVPLRTYAAIGLVEMERQDVDGVAEMQRAIQKLDGTARDQIVEGLADGLITLMKKAPAQASLDGAPPPYQVRAKDAAFLLVSAATPAVREKLTTAVVSWYTEDFNGRSLSGNFSAEQVVRALGSAAAKSLVDALSAKLPQQALVKLAELIGQLGEPGVKRRAGHILVQIEHEMEGPQFLEWLKSQIADQMKQGGKIDPKRLESAAELNRNNFIETGALTAMKYLADQPEVAARLLEIASLKEARLTDRRTRALQALEGKVTSAQLEALLGLALDPSNPVSVRDYAFDRVGDIRDPKAIPPMWPLVQDSEDQRLRWRAGELVLTIGGNALLSEFFAKLPGGATSYEPEELDGYAQRMTQMTPLPRELAIAQLHSPNWWHNVIALDFLQRKGSEADVAEMSALTHSSTATKGKHWDDNQKTVGKVAEQAIAALRERVKEESGGNVGSAPK
ncbi:MAG TPA: HEAT repeat domain-containing protein [Polyangiales bacterium]